MLLIAGYQSARVIGFERLAAYLAGRALRPVQAYLPKRVAAYVR